MQSADFLWYLQRAEAIVRGEGYSINGMPTAFWPVGWPAVLALLFSVTGVSVLAGQLLNIALALACVWMTAKLGEALSGRRSVGNLAALLIAIYPNQIAYVPLLTTEIFYEALLLAAVLLLMRVRARWGTAVLVGLLFGVATLVKAQSMVLPGFLLACVWLARPSRAALGRFGAQGAVLYLVLLLVVLPWTYRNWTVYHSVIPVSTNGGWTLLTGNSPEANGTYTPLTTLGEGLSRDPRDEVVSDRTAKARAVDWIKQHPMQFVRLMPKKVFYLWAIDGEAEYFYDLGMGEQYQRNATLFRAVRWLNELYYVVLVLAAVPAMLSLFGRVRATPWAFCGIALFAFFTLLSMVFSGQSRFHFSLMPFMAVYAAWTIWRWTTKVGASSGVIRSTEGALSR